MDHADCEKADTKNCVSNFKKNKRLFLKTIFHSLFLVHHIVVQLYAFCVVFNKASKHKDGKVKEIFLYMPAYATNWNFAMFQTIFLLLALAYDALEWMEKQNSSIGSRIRYWRDVLFCGLVVPYTCFVFGMFWVVYTIDRELVFPRVYDEVIPWWFNQCVHTNILVLVAVETLLQSRRHPTQLKLELILNGVVGILYAIVYYSIYFFAHRWLYNVFSVMTWWQVCLFQLCIWSSSFIFYMLQFPINRIFHGPEPELEKVAEVSKETFGEIKEAGGEGDVEKNHVGDVLSVNCVPLEKSWSLKYRSMRNDYQNSSI